MDVEDGNITIGLDHIETRPMRYSRRVNML